MTCGKPEDDDGEMPARRVQARSGKCVKCRVNDIEFSKMAAGYCKECFVIVMGRRFKDVAYLAREHCRAQKGASDKKNGSILLSYSGSTASRTALDFIKTLYFPEVAPNTRTQPAFSDIEVLYVRTALDTDETVEQHQKTVAEYGFKLIVVGAERIYADSDRAIDITSSDLTVAQAGEATPALLADNAFTATSQETLSSIVLASYVTKYAEEHNHKAVIFCDTATKLAAKTLAAISKGQGWNLGELVGAGDIPVAGSDVRIYRPLSGMSDEEIRFFAEQVQRWPQDDNSIKRSGIDGLVEGFVRNLEAGFPSTVSVISRTASKLDMRSVEKSNEKIFCALCRLPRDTKTLAWRPVASLSKFDQQIDASQSASISDSFASMLCYGCLVPFMELQGPAKKAVSASAEHTASIRRLPAYVTLPTNAKATDKANSARSGMRAQIEEFLL